MNETSKPTGNGTPKPPVRPNLFGDQPKRTAAAPQKNISVLSSLQSPQKQKKILLRNIAIAACATLVIVFGIYMLMPVDTERFVAGEHARTPPVSQSEPEQSHPAAPVAAEAPIPVQSPAAPATVETAPAEPAASAPEPAPQVSTKDILAPAGSSESAPASSPLKSLGTAAKPDHATSTAHSSKTSARSGKASGKASAADSRSTSRKEHSSTSTSEVKDADAVLLETLLPYTQNVQKPAGKSNSSPDETKDAK